MDYLLSLCFSVARQQWTRGIHVLNNACIFGLQLYFVKGLHQKAFAKNL